MAAVLQKEDADTTGHQHQPPQMMSGAADGVRTGTAGGHSVATTGGADTIELGSMADLAPRDAGTNTTAPPPPPPETTPPKKYVEGRRKWILTAGIWIALFLSTLESTIVSTSLVSITTALNGFLIRDWIVTAYLLTYTGFLTIYAKISDIFGRKTMFVLALAVFTVFSILCGISNNIVELIVFRAFQGIGASGIYSMIMVIAPDMVPPDQYGKYMAIVATVFIVASVLGPILGGVINTHSSWRWVFLLNAPGGTIALAIIIFFMPTSEQSSKIPLLQRLRVKLTRSAFARVDTVGIVLLLASSVLLVFALEQGGTRYPWRSAPVIATLVISLACGVGFAFWEVYVEKSKSAQEPVFPMSILKNRLISAMLLTAFFTGFPFVSIVVNIPQRAQAVAGKSPLDAGIALLPMLLSSPLATAASGFLTGNFKVPPFYLIVGSACLQLLGVGLTVSLPTDVTGSVPREQYGYEVLMGIGFGMGLTTLLTFGRAVVTDEHLAVAMGAMTQVRVLGGTIALAVCATILNNHIGPRMLSIVSPQQAAAIKDSLAAINDLSPEQQQAVRHAFAEGYHRQNIFMTALTAVGLVSALFLWERRPRRAPGNEMA